MGQLKRGFKGDCHAATQTNVLHQRLSIEPGAKSRVVCDRPELVRMIGDLQPGEVVITEKIDRISRLTPRQSSRSRPFAKKELAWRCPVPLISLN